MASLVCVIKYYDKGLRKKHMSTFHIDIFHDNVTSGLGLKQDFGTFDLVLIMLRVNED